MKFDQFDLKSSFRDARDEGIGSSLSSSHTEPLTPSFLLKGRREALQHFLSAPLAYPAQGGSAELKHAASSFAGGGTDAEIILCNGADDGIVLTCLGLLSAGDRMIVQTPSYQAWTGIPRALGCVVEFWRAEPEDKWRPDLEKLARLLRRGPRPRAVVISTPCNPTGFAFDRAGMDEIRAMTEHHGCLLVIDNVHSFSGSDCSPIPMNQISLGSCSKALGLPGLRLGWIITGSADLSASLDRVQSYLGTYMHPAAELLGPLAFSSASQILERSKRIVDRNLRLIDAFMEERSESFGWVRPMEGCVALIECLREDATRLALHASGAAGIHLATGPAFGVSRRFFRLGFGTNLFGTSLERFNDFLATR